ncbi:MULTISPECIES: NAD(P)-binding domain-containing protein [Actinoalloteichus]|uniref:Pyridine nucleotide-disulfide oxidoreductase n=1 Tax=Actinoalloteichus fjordicus TaxID=1612552 RepID=A0AAC9L9L5_9PSEU|nr:MULTISPECIES: NAD(P)-binding domain-containing protein [Actinoalloteichus]APU13376.1 Pyridine nucleotide-disulfide oxidoreductase [Actinoalloteichus fjordicus]APU19326.1 Pyridine nucleotide-disulfide oxidoreductase [Actinoalloteichus sp. GBA129-24]
MRTEEAAADVDVVVIGAGQAGLSTGFHLRRTGHRPETGYVLLDAPPGPGGAWQFRWPTLRMATVHGVHDLPGLPMGPVDETARAATVVPAYFADYEKHFALPVHRPVQVRSVRPEDDDPQGRLRVETDRGEYSARAVINATGTWTRPFWPSVPGQADFRGRQLHTVDYQGPAEFAGARVVVVGGGSSAIQLLAEIAGVAETTWVTRRPPVFHEGPFTHEHGRAAVALVDEAVRAGRPPESVVGVTGLLLTPEVRQMQEAGLLNRLPMFDSLSQDGPVWDDGRAVSADVILYATGFRAALDHLRPLRLREPGGGIVVENTRVPAEPRVQLVGYGPSASTVGATRAGRFAVRDVNRLLGRAPLGSSAVR